MLDRLPITHVGLRVDDLIPSRTSLSVVSSGWIVQGDPTAFVWDRSHTTDTHISSVDVSRRSELCLQLHDHTGITRPGDDVTNSTSVFTSFLNSDVYTAVTATDCNGDKFLSYTSEQRQWSPDGNSVCG